MYPDPQIIARVDSAAAHVFRGVVDAPGEDVPAHPRVDARARDWSDAMLAHLRALADLPLADVPMRAQSVPPPVGDPIAPDPHPPNPVTPEPIQPGPGDPNLPGRPEVPAPGPAQRPLGRAAISAS
ncbi:MAG: hypothetical protein AB7P21_18055 [Lautropia sp.]